MLLKDHPLFSAFSQEYREYASRKGVNPVVHFKILLVLATVPVHETSLDNQNSIVCFWVGGGGM